METTKTEKSRYGVADFCRDEELFQKEVEPRMKELLQMNDQTIDYSNKSVDGWKAFDKKYQRQNELMDELEKHAYDARSLTGRILRFQMADSYAIYLVVKVNKTTCRVQWIDWCDGWVDDRLGESGSLPLDYVHDQICWKDNLNKAFSK